MENPNAPRRYKGRRLRIPGYDYSTPGYYFVTSVTHERRCLFGEVKNDVMHLSDLGKTVEAAWKELPERYEGIEHDMFVFMPNHLHGIVVLDGNCPLSGVMMKFKSWTGHQFAQRNPGATLWQKSYHDHVVRGDEDLAQLREYFSNNPLKWALDEENVS